MIMGRLKAFFTIAALVLCSPVVLFSQERNGGPVAVNMNYGSNIVRLAPITVMDVGVGFGLSYEKIFGANQTIGVILPFNVLLENSNSSDFYTGAYNQERFNSYIYFTPGIKFYPFGQRRVTYAVGPNLMIGYGANKQMQSYTNSYGGVYLEDVVTTRVRLGVLVNNYVNFQVSPLFNVGLEGGLGMRYYDRTSYSGSQFYAGNGDIHNGFDIAGQFSLTLGLRF